MKKCITVFLAVSMMANSVLIADNGEITAKAEETIAPTKASTVASLLSNEATDTIANDSYYISDIQVADSEATVVYQTLENANLTVAFYAEDTMRLEAVATSQVSANETIAKMDIEGDLPEYYIATAYLTNLEDHAPLCDAYTSKMYTQEIQKLIETDIHDYDESRTVNFDSDEKTNFAVYGDDTIVAEETDSENVLTDNGGGMYTIDNASDEVVKLKKGDVLAVEKKEGDVVVISVASISISGSTVRISNQENVEIEDVFDYVKFNSDCDSSKMSVDTSDMDEVLEFEGISEKENSSQIEKEALDAEASLTYEAKYKITKEGLVKDDKDANHKDLNASVSGTIKFAVSGKISVYISRKYKSVSAVVEGEVTPSITFQGKYSHDFKLGLVRIPMQAPGVYVNIKPSVPISATGALSFSGSLKMTLGAAYDTDNGIQNKCTLPKLSGKVKAEATVSVGLKGNVSIAVISDDLVSVGITPKISAEAVAVLAKNTSPDSVQHSCKACIDGDINVKFDLEINAKVGSFEKKKSFPKAAIGFKVADFFYSIDKDVFGMGECPYINHKVTVKTVDANGNPVVDVKIGERGKEVASRTDDKGLATLYLPNGKYEIVATNEVAAGSVDLVVKGKERAITIVIKDGYEITTDMELFGDSYVAGDGSICLTECTTWSSGAIWYPKEIDTTNGFSVDFKYKAGGGRSAPFGGADGIVLDFASQIGLGDQGEYLGFVDGYGVELDSYDGNSGDPKGKHFAIIKDKVRDHVEYVQDDRVDDGSWHLMSVTYDSHAKKLIVSVDNKSILSASNIVMRDTVFMGLTAATGDGKNYHYVDDFFITSGKRNISVCNAKMADSTNADNEDIIKPATVHFGEEKEDNGETVVEFDDLNPGERYLLADVIDTGAERLFGYSNLLYISQGIADSEGKLSFTFLPRNKDYSSIRLYGITKYQADDENLKKELVNSDEDKSQPVTPKPTISPYSQNESSDNKTSSFISNSNRNTKTTIKKQKLSVKTVKYTVKVGKGKKIYLKVKNTGDGRITYKVTKYPKKSKKYIKVSQKGKVILKKGIKKGIYKITITAAKTKKYKKATKIITIKVK